MSSAEKSDRSIYIKVPPSDLEYFKQEMFHRLNQIKAGPEPHFANLCSIIANFQESPLDTIIVSWVSFIHILCSVPKCGLRATILQIFDITEKIRFWTCRLAGIVQFLPRTQPAMQFQEKIYILLNNLQANEPLTSEKYSILKNMIETISKLANECELGPNHFRAYLKITFLLQILEQLKEKIDKIGIYMQFMMSINSISEFISKYTVERLEMINTHLTLYNDCHINPYDTEFKAKIQITNDERFLLLQSIDAISQLGFKISTDEGIEIIKSNLLTPSLNNIFTNIIEIFRLTGNDQYLGQFRDKIFNVVFKPPSRRAFTDLYTEILMVSSFTEFTNEKSPAINALLQQLQVIHSILMLLVALDYLGICPYGNTIRKIYLRTYCSRYLNKDLFISSLIDQVPQKIVDSINNALEKANLTDASDTKRSIIAIIRTMYLKTIYELNFLPYDSFKPVYKFLFQAENNSIQPTEVKHILAILSPISQQTSPNLFKLRAELTEFYKKSFPTDEIANAADFMWHFIKKFSRSSSSKSNQYRQSLFDEFLTSVKFLQSLNLLIVNPTIDIQNLKIDENFGDMFVNLIHNMNINSPELVRKCNSTVEKLQTNQQSKNIDIIVYLDQILRGSLDLTKLNYILGVNAQPKSKDVYEIIFIFVNLIRVFQLRDEFISYIMITDQKYQEQDIFFQSLKQFNAKRFIDGFTTILLYIHSITISQNVTTPPDFVQCLINLRNVNEEIPDFVPISATQTHKTDAAFWSVYTRLSGVRIEKLVPVINNLLNIMVTDIFTKQSASELIARIEAFATGLHNDHDSIGKMTDLIKALTKSQNLLKPANKPLIDQVIISTNTISLYKHTLQSLYTYFQFLVSPSVPFINLQWPFLINNVTQSSGNIQIMPLQIFVGPILGDANTNNCSDRFNTDIAKSLIEDTNFEDELNYSFNPKRKLSIGDQNKLLQILSQEMLRYKPENSNNPRHNQLMRIRKEIAQEKKKSFDLMKLKNDVSRSRQRELLSLKRQLSDNIDNFKHKRSMFDVELKAASDKIASLNTTIESKQQKIEELQQNINLAKRLKQLQEPDDDIQLFHEDFSNISFSGYVIKKQENEVVVQIHHEEEDEIHAPDVSREFVKSEEEEEKREFVEEVDAPSSLKHIIGDKWPKHLQKSIEASVKGNKQPDSISVMKTLKDATPEMLTKIRNTLLDVNNPGDDQFLVKDILRRQKIMKEMLN